MDDDFTLPQTQEDLIRNWDDTHAWLEDEEGNVWDHITEEDIENIKSIDPRKRIKKGFIQGESYRELLDKGYELIPYTEEQRQDMLKILITRRLNREDYNSALVYQKTLDGEWIWED